MALDYGQRADTTRIGISIGISKYHFASMQAFQMLWVKQDIMKTILELTFWAENLSGATFFAFFHLCMHNNQIHHKTPAERATWLFDKASGFWQSCGYFTLDIQHQRANIVDKTWRFCELWENSSLDPCLTAWSN